MQGVDESILIFRNTLWDNEMVWWVKVPASKSDVLSWTPGAHRVKEKT